MGAWRAVKWAVAMAWRDMRSAKRKLALFALAVVSGVAALVAIDSFRDNLEAEMDRQSSSLLGADVEYESRRPFSDEALALIERVPASATARQMEFGTMAYFPKQDDSRLVTVRAMEGSFPWYGTLETRPAGLRVADSDEPAALVEDSLMIQYDLEIGDEVTIGQARFRVIGELLRMPGQGAFTGSFAPRVLIPMSFVESTGLAQFGSRLEYVIYQQFDQEQPEASAEALRQTRRRLERMEVDVDTVADQRRRIGRTLDSMNSFLSMIGFVALLLGGVAIAGAVSVYLKGKVDTVATLRCLGASAARGTAIYCIQISLVGLLGCFIGAGLGIGIQWLLPSLMASLLPVELELSVSWPSVAKSLAFGWLFTTLFAFLPLLPLRRVSPLRAIRASVESPHRVWKDWAILLVVAALAGLTALFTLSQTRTLTHAAGFFGGIVVAITALAAIGALTRGLLRRASTRSLPYVWRQGLANLHRPQNRTTMLVVTLGMGAFLIYTIYVSEQSMLRQGDLLSNEGQPNVIMFDIQPDQVEGIEEIVQARGLNMEVAEPIVTMRLHSLNGQSAEALRKDPTKNIEGWAARREYRSTFRDFLREDEELLEGAWVARAALDSEEPVPISVEARIIEALKLQLGDRIVWDVQGFPVESVVTSIRKVDWRQMKPNFFVVFPAGVLEAAPAFYVTAAHAPSQTDIVALQGAVVRSYPNVSVVNLTMILQSLQNIFDKVSFVIRFMASFTIVTGLIALMASVLTSRYQRLRESALLRTIGASSRQIRGIMGVEYALVGAIAGLSGIVLSLGASWALARWIFNIQLYVPWGATVATVLGVALLTWLTGMINSLGIARQSPMEAIRQEAV